MSAGNEKEFIDYLQNKEKGGKAMKCPIIPAVSYSTLDELTVKRGDCLKEECAWWDNHSQKCAITTISSYINEITGDVGVIRAQMPHEEQFRR